MLLCTFRKVLVPLALHISLLGSWRYEVSPYYFLSEVHSSLSLSSEVYSSSLTIAEILSWICSNDGPLSFFSQKPNLAPEPKIQSYKCHIQWNNHFLWSVGYPLAGATRHIAGLLFARIPTQSLKKTLSNQSAPRLYCCWDYSSPRAGSL